MWRFLANLDSLRWLFLACLLFLCGCSWLAVVADCAIDRFVVFFFFVVECIILL